MRRWLKVVLGVCVVGVVLACVSLAIISFWPDVAAQNIDRLRDVIGDAPVAQLEETVLNVQDHVQQIEFQMGVLKPAAPWANATSAPGLKTPLPAATVPTIVAQPIGNSAAIGGTLPPPTMTPGGSIPVVTPIESVTVWQLPPLSPFGTLAGEGQWSPYLQSPTGQTVAYRTFLQPDPTRSYSTAAIVAFDLKVTRLHFVLGTVEPLSATPQPSRTGTIAATDLEPGILLATFNGGFKARHGHYGAMADGLIALPALKGTATVAMYADGHVKIGAWGTDIQDSPDLVAWRQNGELLIHNDQINPDTARTTATWGLTIKGDAITWRSALGLSADGATLYYVAGLQLDVATLTKVMAQTGATEALQLDVNAFWVHFAAIRSSGSALVAEPLLDAMKSQVDRYLKPYSRDFFYVTTA